ncbi:hypothetical protein L1887_31171 [Cichorium endivia]|nr:hypothetical protein L1887_31171 [Cichorium endivia]
MYPASQRRHPTPNYLQWVRRSSKLRPRLCRLGLPQRLPTPDCTFSDLSKTSADLPEISNHLPPPTVTFSPPSIATATQTGETTVHHPLLAFGPPTLIVDAIFFVLLYIVFSVVVLILFASKDDGNLKMDLIVAMSEDEEVELGWKRAVAFADCSTIVRRS